MSAIGPTFCVFSSRSLAQSLSYAIYSLTILFECHSIITVYTVDDAKATTAAGVQTIRGFIAAMPDYVPPEDDGTAVCLSLRPCVPILS